MYEGGEPENVRNIVVTHGGAKNQKEMEQLQLDATAEIAQEQQERQERARKNVDKEIKFMWEAKRTWPRSKTLFYGLRFDWRSQILTMHISLFLVRRVIMAALLVFGGKIAYWGL